MLTLSGSGYERLAQSTVVGFEIPYLDHFLDKRLAPFVWRMIQYVFRLPDLRLGLRDDLDADDRAACERYVTKAKELAASPYLAHETGYEMHATREGGVERHELTVRFPHKESTTGFLTSFRQFFDHGEPASYSRIQTIARSQLVLESLETSPLDRWGQVHKKLRRRSPKTWVELKAHRLDTDTGGRSYVANLHQPRISELIEMYLYGDLVHFGTRTSELARIQEDDFDAAFHEMTLHEGVVGLTMLYLGVAAALESALR